MFEGNRLRLEGNRCRAVIRRTGRGKLGTGEIWKGNNWHNKNVPNSAVVF